MSKWQRLSGKMIYQNNYLSLHEDQVITPDGRSSIYGWVETPPAVFIVAMNDKKQICLIEQERYLTGRTSWEIPAGNTDGEDELDAAKRELAEEAGLTASHWERLPGDVFPFSSLSTERDIIYLATDLHKSTAPIGPTDDVITDLKWVTWAQVKELMVTAEITNGQTITALALAGLHLGKLK